MTLSLAFRIVLTASVMLAVGCEKHDAHPPLQTTILPVSASVVRCQGSFMYPVNYYGRIEPARHSALSFELAGRLEQVLVDEGKRLQAGQIVASLDTSMLEAEKDVLLAQRNLESVLLDRLRRGERKEVVAAARAEAMRLEVELRRASAEKDRAEKVYAGRSISKSDYDQAVYTHKAAVFSSEQARARLEELESGSRTEDIDAQASRVAMIDAQLGLLNVRFAKSSIVAPFDAICVRRLQDEGVTLLPAQTILEINEANRLEARFSIPQQNLALAVDAKHLMIDGDPYAIQDVRQVSQVDDTTRTVDIVIPLRGNADNRIFPGQTCTLQIAKQVDTKCIELPIGALVASVRGLWSCYRLQPNVEDGRTYRVEKFDVSVIHTDGVRVFVNSTLPDRSLIIRSGTHKVVPGMLVRIVDDER